jgi:uncharacterized damage-inducible protein DinB
LPRTYVDLARRLRFNEKLLAVETAGFTPEDWHLRPSAQGGNDAHWILGHVTQGRRMLARILGAAIETAPWEHGFGMNAKPDGTHAGYPDPAELARDFSASGERLEALLGDLTSERADSTWRGRPMPDGSQTLGDVLHFLYFHETYHLGQIGLLRRLAGKPGFA